MKLKNNRFLDELEPRILMLMGNDWEARILVEYTEDGWQVAGVELDAVFNGSTMSRFSRAAEVDLDSLSQVDRDHLDATVREAYDGDL